jgi:hypothetical protein
VYKDTHQRGWRPQQMGSKVVQGSSPSTNARTNQQPNFPCSVPNCTEYLVSDLSLIMRELITGKLITRELIMQALITQNIVNRTLPKMSSTPRISKRVSKAQTKVPRPGPHDAYPSSADLKSQNPERTLLFHRGTIQNLKKTINLQAARVWRTRDKTPW